MNPDIERVVYDYLRTNSAVVAAMGATPNIATHLASDAAMPAARVTLLGGPQAGRPLVIEEHLMQVDVWDTAKTTAHTVAAALRLALVSAANVVASDGVLSGCRVGGLVYDEDPDFDPARPRYRFDATVITR